MNHRSRGWRPGAIAILGLVAGFGLATVAGAAGMADHARRAQAAGIDVITYRTEVKDVVVIQAWLPAGDAFAGVDNAAIPTLTGMLLDRGTKARDKYAIAQALDNVGAEISVSVGVQSAEVRAKCLKKDLAMVIGLIAEELRSPAFLPEEFARAKQQFIGQLQASLQSPEGRGREAFERAIYPQDHPNHPHSTAEFLSAAQAATLDQVKAFHAKYYGPAHFTMVLVGDVDASTAQDTIAKSFAGWTGGVDFIRRSGAVAAPGYHLITVPLADKPSVSVYIGQSTGLRYEDPDALALRVGTAILGRGFTGRLMSTVRDKEGLTYNIGATVGEDSFTEGAWELDASFAPALLDKGVAAARRELQNWWKNGVTDKELADRKEGIVGSYLVSLSTTAGLANSIMTAIQRGYGLDWLDRYPDAVKALTVDQVNAAISRHLDPAAMVLIEAGSVPAR
jgi:zinc protease